MKDQLNSLVEKVFNEKKFLFDKDEIQEYYKNSDGKYFEDLNGHKFRIKATPLFTESLYNHLAKRYKFELTNQFISTINFYSKVFSDFKSKRNFQGLSEQMRALLSLLIVKTNKQYKETFENFALGLNKEKNKEFLYVFCSSFSDCLYKLNIPVDILYKILRHLLVHLEAKVAYNNLSKSQFLHGLRKYSKYSPDDAKKILAYSQENGQNDITSAILSGLYDNDSEEGLKLLQEQLKSEKNQAIVPNVVANQVPKNRVELNNLFRLFKNVKSSDDIFLINLVRAYINLIKHSSKGNAQLVRSCFARIYQLASVSSSLIQQNILIELRYLDGYDRQKYHVIEILNSKELDTDLLYGISDLLSYFSEVDKFFNFLREYAVNNKLKFEAENFDLPIDHFRNSDPRGFNEHLIYLLIDDLGQVRFVGYRILSHLNIYIGPYTFEFDLTTLTELDQIKLWVSILQCSMEPKYSLPLVLPLRKSRYSLVVESLIYKVVEMVENYPSAVSNQLKELLDLDDEADEEFYKRVELEYNVFKNLCNDKSNIKELNPHYTQSKLYRIFNENFNERISGDMEKSVKSKSSILDYVSTIKLTKGGGWKMDPERPVSQLSEISASFQFPRWSYLAPEKYDYELHLHFIENWKDKFKEWEVIIYSSENT